MLELPPEIVDAVISQLRDDSQALQSCSLVSREFLHFAQYQLHGTIYIDWYPQLDLSAVPPKPSLLASFTSTVSTFTEKIGLSQGFGRYEGGPGATLAKQDGKRIRRDIYRFQQFITANPHLARFVRHIHIHPQYGAGSAQFDSAIWLPFFFSSIPNLQSLTLRYVHIIAGPLLNRNLVESPAFDLDHLRLDRANFTTPSALNHLFSYLRRVKVVESSYCNIMTLDNIGVPSSGNSQLRIRRLYLHSFGTLLSKIIPLLAPFLNDPTSTASLELQSLDAAIQFIDYSDQTSVDPLGQLIFNSRETLTELGLETRCFQYDPRRVDDVDDVTSAPAVVRGMLCHLSVTSLSLTLLVFNFSFS